MSTRARPRVVVAGLGDSGLLTATHLARHVDVVGISTKPALVSGQELGLRLICEGLLSSGRSKCRPVLCRAALLSWAGGRASWRSGSATRCRD